jgi:hypothetical protein
MKILTRVVLIVCTLAIALMMTGCGGGGGGSNPFTYFKASNTDTGDEFGRSVALSDDGTTLAVGADLEASDGVTVPIESNNSVTAAGAVYVFTSVGGWQQQAYVKAPSPVLADHFGFSVALSADGNTLAVGAPQTSVSNGVVYIYTRSGSTWTYKNAVTGGTNSGFGWAVALSDNGSVLAVGAPFESTSANSSGALYVFTTINSWSSVATTDTIKSAGAASEANAQLGVSIALNGNGTVLAGGANQISSAGPGFVKIFIPTGGSGDWATNTGYNEAGITATDGETDDQFGVSVSLNTAGDILAVGAWQEDSNTITDTTNNGAADSGAAYVFVTGDNWVSAPTETYVKASSPVANDNFGTSVSLNGSGDTLGVGAPFAANTGTAYRIVNSGTWAGGIGSELVITPPSGDNGDEFGFSVSLSATAGRLAIGDKYEDSAATGVNGDKTDNTKPDSGAAYVRAL